jgi:DNA-directed RNA polymerase omega subunit
MIEAKPFVKTLHSIEQYDIDRAVKNFDDNRYNMIVVGAQRALEIADLRRKEVEREPTKRWVHKPNVQALIEIAAGEIGPDYVYVRSKMKRNS